MSVPTHLDEDVPSGPLYHYTTHAGLLGIIESKSIWATNSTISMTLKSIGMQHRSQRIASLTHESRRQLLSAIYTRRVLAGRVCALRAHLSDQSDLLIPESGQPFTALDPRLEG
jgi:hypothetical protein